MKSHIVKAQRSLYPNNNQVLVYDEHHEIFYQFPFAGALARIMGEQLKVYLKVRFVNNNMVILRTLFDLGW